MKVDEENFESRFASTNLVEILPPSEELFDLRIKYKDNYSGFRREIINLMVQHFSSILEESEDGKELKDLITEKTRGDGPLSKANLKVLMREKGAGEEIDEAEGLNEYLNKFFSNITYNDKPITMNTLSGDISSSKINIKDPFSEKQNLPRFKSEKILERMKARTDSISTNMFKTIEDMPSFEKLLKGIDEYYENITSQVKTKKGKAIDVKDEIRSKLGNTLKRGLEKRKEIYKFWEDKSKEFDSLVTIINGLKETKIGITQEEIDDEKRRNRLIKTAKVLAENGQYIQKIKPVNLITASASNEKAQALLIFTEMLKRIGYDIDKKAFEEYADIEEGATKFRTEEGRQKYTALANSIQESYKNIVEKTEMDIIGKLYAEKYMGSFIPARTLRMKKLIQAYSRKITLPLNEIEAINDAAKDITSMKKIENSYFPSFYDNKTLLELSTYKADEDEYGKSELIDIITDAIEAIADYVESTRFREGTRGSVTFITGKKNYKANQADEAVSRTYGQRTRPRPFSARENLDEKIIEYIEAFYEYYIKPSFDKTNNVGLRFPYQNDRNTKALIMFVSQKPTPKSTATYSTLVQNLATKNIPIKKNQANTILKFLKSLEGEIDINKVIREGRRAIKVIQAFFKNDDTKRKQVVEDFSLLVGSIWKKMNPNVPEKTRLFGSFTIDDVKEDFDVRDSETLYSVLEFIDDNKQKIPLGENISNIFNELKKKEIQDKILNVHDSLRIMKGMETFYGRNSIDEVEHIDWAIRKVDEKYNMDIIANEIVKAVSEIDSFSNIAKSLGITEEVVYFLKASFR